MTSAAAKAIGKRDIISCIRYSPSELRTDTREQMEEKTNLAIKAFGSDEKLCFSCVGIDADTDCEKIREYLSVFRKI